MPTRQKIKANADAAFKAQYWMLVGILIVGSLLTGDASGFSSYRFSSSEAMDNPQFRTIFTILLVISAIMTIAGLLYGFLFGNVVSVGIAKVSLSAYEGQSVRFTDLFSGLKQYRRNIGTMALYTLFILLGYMCLFVPGIIVSLGLFEVPYLLADDPSVSGMDAIRRSWENMKGHKGELFVFGLSFIGWILLTILTLGVVAIFYSGPYMQISYAGFYRERHPVSEEATCVTE